MGKNIKNPNIIQKFFARGLLVIVPFLGALLLLLWIFQALGSYLYLMSLLVIIPVMIL